MESVIRKRLERAKWAIDKAREFAECAREVFKGRVSVILFGSYARGDFNEWSDIDVLVVVDGDLPRKPTDRIEMVIPCIVKTEAPIEPIILTRDEFEKLKQKRNPVVVDALSNGIPLV